MKLRITVHGVAYEVDVEVLDAGNGFPAQTSLSRPAEHRPASGAAPAAPASAAKPVPKAAGDDGGSVASPIAGLVVEINCKVGDTIKEGQVLLAIEAMKMKTSIAAPTSGTIKAIPVAVGDSVQESQALVEFA